jgi:glycine hydroxymethyltransferase
MYKVVSYGVSAEDEQIDYDQVYKLCQQHKPQMVVCGASAYPRIIDFAKLKEAAASCGAYLMADAAHIMGLIVTGLHPSPVPVADFTTTTTHKTLRGPRGGVICMGKDFENRLGVVAPKSGRTRMMSEIIDSTIMPGIQGGPLMHVIAAKAVAFGEALKPEFKQYQKQIVHNAQALAESLKAVGFNLVSGGTDNHLMLINLTNKNITGKDAEKILGKVNITVNKNGVPFDERSPLVTSGIRLGTPALTSRGMKEAEMKVIAQLIDQALAVAEDEAQLTKIKSQVNELCQNFPLYQ